MASTVLVSVGGTAPRSDRPRPFSPPRRSPRVAGAVEP